MTLEERIAKLERSNRRLTALLVVIFLLFVIGGAVSAKAVGTLDEVRAKRFILVDESGNNRGFWGEMKGSTLFSLHDSDGALGFLLEANDLMTHFQMFGKKGKEGKVHLTVGERGAGVSLFDNQDRLRTLIHVTDGNPGFLMFDENGITRNQWDHTNDTSGLVFYGKDGAMRISLGETREITGMAVFDKNGKPIWSTPMQ